MTNRKFKVPKSKLKKAKLSIYTPYEEVILRCLMRARRQLTTRQIADKTRLSWITVMKHVSELEKKNKIKKQEFKNRTYWEIG